MTEAAAEPGSVPNTPHPLRWRRTAARPEQRAHPAFTSAGRAARPPAASGRQNSRSARAVGDALLPTLLVLNVVTTRAPHELPAAVALSVALTLPLAWRHRAPRTVFAVVAAAALVQLLTGVVLPADVALLVALHAVAARCGRRTTLAAGTLVAAGGFLACLRWATDGAFLTPFVALTATTLAVTVLGVNARTARALLTAQEERAARLRQEERQQARLAAAEARARIAREMHDIVTHNLSVMVALTDAAVHAQRRSPDRATAAMLQISETGRQALTDMRRTLGLLRADEPDAERHPLPGIAQLDSLAAQMGAAGLPTRLDVRGGHTHIPATAQLTLYRLVQEALTNTLQHTPTGTRAAVRLLCSAEAVTVHVTDDGPRPPLAPAPPSGHGIPGMRERAAAYGGTLRAGPLPDGGWEVRTCLVLGSGGGATA